MSQITDLDTLFDCQKNWEAALSAYLTANEITAYTSRGTETLPDSNVICIFMQGPATGRKAPHTTTNTGVQEEDQFDAQIYFEVNTERAVDTVATSTRLTHDQRVARIRTLMLRGAMNGTIAGITALDLSGRYAMPAITMSSFTDNISDRDGIDTTIITFALQFNILASAWPASS